VLAFFARQSILVLRDGGEARFNLRYATEVVRHLKVHDGRVTALAIHPSGKYFATGSAREEVRDWNLDGKLQGESRFVEKATRPVSAAYALAFSPDGDKLVAATQTGKEPANLRSQAQPLEAIKCPTVIRAGRWLFKIRPRLAATANNTVVVWTGRPGSLVHVSKSQ